LNTGRCSTFSTGIIYCITYPLATEASDMTRFFSQQELIELLSAEWNVFKSTETRIFCRDIAFHKTVIIRSEEWRQNKTFPAQVVMTNSFARGRHKTWSP